ncbi:helix-turn-helix transcriptional regulator [Aurantiacibacter sediminis]|uniref:LuxR family transcriptional regulator n=1 Tax=Aurantiacibacter sediminis TaxID=2793064 RepID=A0ABS0N0W1_9SPHN|nr:LuxR family transcriptional regulator [Aurantiacibacter sediminis]MBH5321605.1 LuxR family transcriptional regulator [Aurantiacibacter sediminis]
MYRIIAAIDKSTDPAEVLQVVGQGARIYGAIRHSYHFTPIFERQTSSKAIVEASGFPEKWIAIYDDFSFRKNDPIPETIMDRGKVTTWEQVREQLRLTNEDAREFFGALDASGLLHGIGIPLYGPRGRNAYSSFGFAEALAPDSDGIVAALQTIAQAAHRRICMLLDADAMQDVRLSDQETNIMHWIAQGKSNTDIATILDISPNTVSTHTKRIFRKLDTSDRVTATVKSLKLGLISA